MTTTIPSRDPSRRRLIYLSPQLQQLKADTEEGEFSARLTTIVDRYNLICERDLPRFSVAEWSAICDALNGTWLRDTDSVRLIWAEIEDAGRDGLGAKWDVDATGLARRIKDLPAGGMVAVAEAVERFWKSGKSVEEFFGSAAVGIS